MKAQCREVFSLSSTVINLWVINLYAQAPETLWTKTFGGIDYDYGFSVQQTSDGGYILTGITYSFGSGLCDVYLIKTDLSGDTIWTKTYGTVNYEGESLKFYLSKRCLLTFAFGLDFSQFFIILRDGHEVILSVLR